MSEDDRLKYLEELMQPHIPLRVLQEIRQEIANLSISVVDDNYVRNSAGLYCVKREIIEIIDKHIKEIEG